jgi:hypothetical protein
MYLDNNLFLSGSISGSTVTGQSLTSGSILSTNTVDLSTTRDLGAGNEYPILHVVVTTAFTGGTSIEMQVITADDSALSTNVTVVGSSGASAPVTAALTLGARFAVFINPQLMGRSARRYIGARYVITGTYTAGAVVAHLGLDAQDGQRFYPSGFAVN